MRGAPSGYEGSCYADDNGWARWKTDMGCGGCGKKQDDEAGEDEDPGLMAFECPACNNPGCDDCMPNGRGCICLACEESGEFDDV